MKLTTARTFLALAALTMTAAALPAQSQSTQPAAAPQAAQPTTPAPAATKKTTPTKTTTAQGPAADSATAATAPQKGMVWVNTASGVYHAEGTKYYGKTKKGKYMTEADAQKAGYHAAKQKP